MTRYRHRRTSTPTTAFPSPIEPGEIAVNTANRQIAVGDADAAAIGAPLQLIAIRFHDPRANYAAGDLVVESAKIYRAKAAIPPGAFNLAEWEEAGGSGGGATGEFVPISGGVMTGPLTLSGPPMVDGHAANKLYIDQRIIVSDTPPATPADSTLWWCSTDGALYVRYNDGNGPAQWVIASPQPDFTVYALKTDVDAKVAKAGDVMSGNLTISNADPQLIIKKAASGQLAAMYSMNGSLPRWGMFLADSIPETGSDTGSNFQIQPYSDAGAPASPAINIVRSSGLVSVRGDPTAALGVATKQYVDARDMRRNRVVNGAMAISQENGNTQSTTVAGATWWPADQWVNFWNLVGTTANSQRVPGTVIDPAYAIQFQTGVALPSLPVDAYAIIQQRVEGTRTKDLQWGSAVVKQAVVRFDFYTTAPGTYCFSCANGGSTRTFIAPFTSGASGVWTTITVVIPGDYTPPWNGDNTIGMVLSWTIAAGANYIGVAGWNTGNKLVTAATTNGVATASRTFQLKNVGLYVDGNSLGTAPRWTAPDEIEELAICKRYYNVLSPLAIQGYGPNGMWVYEGITYPAMRATPTGTATTLSVTGGSSVGITGLGSNAMYCSMQNYGAAEFYGTFYVVLNARL